MHTLLQPFAIAFALDHGVPAKSHPLLAAKPVRLRSRVYSAPTIPLGLSKLAARPDSPLFTIRWSPKSSLRQSAPFPSQTNNHVTASLGPPPLSYEPLSARCRPQIPLRLAEQHQNRSLCDARCDKDPRALPATEPRPAFHVVTENL